MATRPNQVWSWDITKLAGPTAGNWFHLYVILDVSSRYAMGWLVAARESARLAEELLAEAVHDQGAGHGQLAIHADRGTSMTSKSVTQLLADLGVLRSHSRPHQSNDNPYSESNFKTLKYFPTFPRRFSGLPHARGLRRWLLRPLQPPPPPLRHRPAHPRRRPLRPGAGRPDRSAASSSSTPSTPPTPSGSAIPESTSAA